MKKGVIVTIAATGINLALGVLYSWSVISKNIPAEWNWSETAKSLPYIVACLVFAFMMVPAGRLQDKFGPRIVATFGGIFTGVGLIIASQFTTIGMFVVGFGLFVGSGLGFGYASATPPAVKWFPAKKTGMIAGIVVAGFGLASVYIAPLANYLIGIKGISGMAFTFGVAFMIAVVFLAQFLINPPAAAPAAAGSAQVAKPNEYSATGMLGTWQFYALWLMYAINSGAGLMIIGKLAKLVHVQANFNAGFVLVALLAIGNASGRIIAGTLSDKFGRIRILQFFTAFQCLLMFITPAFSNSVSLVVLSMCIGMNYGSNLALFPSITKDFFGLKNFGVNYGLVFTSWGVGSLLALAAGKIYDTYGSFTYALYLAGSLLVITLVLSIFIKKPGLCTANNEVGCACAKAQEAPASGN